MEAGRFSTPALWIYGALFIGIAGTVAGRLLESAPPGVSLQDTHYVVAHDHYLATVVAVFAVFAGVYFFFPRVTGYRYSEILGKAHFALSFLGVNAALLPMQVLSLQGMPRRYADYPDAYASWNMVASTGAFMVGCGFLIFLVTLVEAFIRRRPSGAERAAQRE